MNGRGDRQATRQAILQAVGTLLAREGFAALGVNAIAREAGVDKVLIYRYFGGLPQLLDAYGRDGGFWPSVDEVLDGVDGAGSDAERLSRFLGNFIVALRARPLTAEILAMEIGTPNALSHTLDQVRQAWGEQVAKRLARPGQADMRQLDTVVSIVLAGIQYLVIRARNTARFSGIAIDGDAGWQQIRSDLHWLCAHLLPSVDSSENTP